MRLLLALLLAAFAVPGSARAQRKLIFCIGDSTIYGTIDSNYGQADVTTAEALQSALRLVAPDHSHRRARVRNFGVPGASTRDWVVGPVNPAVCDAWASHLPHLALACERGVPLVDVLPGSPTTILVTLGYADGVFGIPPEETVANLSALSGRLPDSTVYIAAPFVPDPDDPYKPARDERYAAMKEAGLLTGPDWPPLPLVDQVHLTPGGYAAAAGLWLDFLR
jgi:lysophospholipase L1-like esterase